ncbi:MAG: hypothetical protein L3J08_01590 [Flavobacteriaceae bacterium]|nr:hypothetical protein [Flavobacteriaceae bacterium]
MKDTKSLNKIETVKNNRKLRVFLLFLFLSFLFWMLIKLSKEYISDVEFNIVYTDLPKNKLIQNKSDNKIILTVKTIGFKLLKYGFENKELNYSLSDIKRKRGSAYYSITKSKINHLQAQFSAETLLLKVQPDTLYFDLGIEKSKKIKVISNVNLQFKSGYNLIKKYIIEPEYITIAGPTKIIDSITEINSDLLELSKLSSSFNKKVNLMQLNSAVSLSTNQVTIKGEVAKITEGSFSLPFKVINLPKNYIISTFPKEVKVVYQVALKDYNKINKSSFVIHCDYKETRNNNLEYLIPKIIEKPEVLFDVKIVPNKIEFLIKK